ncbi:MAG: hypothetical protein ACJ8FY_13900 [Gemmataceae bacterium]
MNPPELDSTIRPRVFTLRIIIGALLSGVAIMAVMAIFLRQSGNRPPPPPVPIMTYLALGFGAVLLVMHRFILKLVESNARKRITGVPSESGGPVIEPLDLLGIYQSSRIIAAALLEGPAFFCLIAYLVEGHWLSLAAAGILWIGLLLLFPSVDGVARWIMEQQETIQQERSQQM